METNQLLDGATENKGQEVVVCNDFSKKNKNTFFQFIISYRNPSNTGHIVLK